MISLRNNKQPNMNSGCTEKHSKNTFVGVYM
jgi:hypothetical protein